MVTDHSAGAVLNQWLCNMHSSAEPGKAKVWIAPHFLAFSLSFSSDGSQVICAHILSANHFTEKMRRKKM